MNTGGAIKASKLFDAGIPMRLKIHLQVNVEWHRGDGIKHHFVMSCCEEMWVHK